jgi:hypothetical protein
MPTPAPVTAPPATPPVKADPLKHAEHPATDAAALEARIAQLEEQVRRLQDGRALNSTVENIRIDVEALQKAMTGKPEPAPARAAPAKAQQSRATATKDKPRHAAPAAHKTKGAAPLAPAKSGKWVLKSAKPGMAWVAEPGSSELHTVSVGETVSGLGKIISIAPDAAGNWVVTGTKGKIAQAR